MTDWKTIDSAPTDGTYIQLCQALDADGNPIVGKAFGLFTQVAAWWEGQGWIVYCSQIQEPIVHFVPSHWAPLPTNPLA